MMQLRRSDERGHANHGWLDTYHTFSFAGYYDPAHMGFRSLRVLNDDTVAPGQGFGTHGHRDMEILSFVVEGALEHRDSMGTGSVLRPGDVQRMSAGTGVTHSEFNHSASEPLRFLQVWILPERSGLTPGYEEKAFPREERLSQLRLVASPDGRDGSLSIHQDAYVYLSTLEPGATVARALAPSRHAWLQVVNGSLEVEGMEGALRRGDGLAVTEEKRLVVGNAGDSDAELLLFDLA